MNKTYKILPLFFLLIPLLFISCATKKEEKRHISMKVISSPIITVDGYEETDEEPSGVDYSTEEEIDEEFFLEELTVTGSRRESKTGEAPSGVDSPTEEETDEFIPRDVTVTAEEREAIIVEAPSRVDYPEETTEEEIDEFILGDVTVTAEEHKRADLYKVELGADEIIEMPGIPGELRVWIGLPDYGPNFRDNMVTVEDTLPTVGVTALITPFAPAFEVEPKESICMKIHPSGSEVRFTLKPTQKGVFNVGAKVYLYESDDCTGSPIPKATRDLRVEVKVDHVSVIMLHIKKLWEVFWEKLLNFWAAIIALFFGLLLFFIRGQLKKRFGYRSVGRQQNKEDNN